MRRLALPFVVIALALAGLAASGHVSSAQQATPAALAGHPLVGAWVLNTDTTNPRNALSVAVFTADGIYHQSNADGSDGAGTWRATGANTAILTAVFTAADAHGASAGTAKVRATITVAADGASFTAPYTLEFIDPSGKSSGQTGPGAAVGTRITPEAMGTPVGPIPQGPPSGTPAVGTPSA